jgi:hypothetical protein
MNLLFVTSCNEYLNSDTFSNTLSGISALDESVIHSGDFMQTELQAIPAFIYRQTSSIA